MKHDIKLELQSTLTDILSQALVLSHVCVASFAMHVSCQHNAPICCCLLSWFVVIPIRLDVDATFIMWNAPLLLPVGLDMDASLNMRYAPGHPRPFLLGSIVHKR